MRTKLGIVLVGLLLAVGACSSSGPNRDASPTTSPSTSGSATVPATEGPVTPTGTLPPASAPGTTSPSPSAAATPSAIATPSPTPFALTSRAFREGGEIPSRFTCDGADVSPAIAWAGAPDGTASLALVIIDPDARDFVHWLAYDLSGSPAGGLAEAASASADAPRQGMNDFGKRGYGGPCPPSGTHHYRLTLYALDRTLALTGTPTRDDLIAAMRGHVLAQVTVTSTYRRH